MIKFNKVGRGEETIVFLHGWAMRKENYIQLINLLSKKCVVYALDLPGFGETPINRPYYLSDYARDVAGFIEGKKIKRPVLMGHSFGGRVAIKLAISRPELISKLVLVDSGGIERKSLRVKAVKWLAALTPFRIREPLRPMVGSKDYLESVGLVRETMKKVVAENLEFDLPKIKVQTLLVWGKNDHTTPLWQGELMHKLIPGSELKVIDGDHGIPYRKAQEVAGFIVQCLKRDNR